MAATLNDSLVGFIRTAVPVAVGAAIAFLAAHGFAVDPAQVTTVITPIVIAVYYAAVKWAEKRWPEAGWLLGYPVAPTYNATPATPTEEVVKPAGDVVEVPVVPVLEMQPMDEVPVADKPAGQ